MGICVSLFKVSFHISIFLSSLVGRKKWAGYRTISTQPTVVIVLLGDPLLYCLRFRFLISYLLFFQSSFKLNIVCDLL